MQAVPRASKITTFVFVSLIVKDVVQGSMTKHFTASVGQLQYYSSCHQNEVICIQQ